MQRNRYRFMVLAASLVLAFLVDPAPSRGQQDAGMPVLPGEEILEAPAPAPGSPRRNPVTW